MFCIFYILTNSATICKIKKKIPDQSKEKVARRVRYSTKKLVIYESLYALVYFCEILLVQIDTILLIFLRIFTYQKIASALIILSPPLQRGYKARWSIFIFKEAESAFILHAV